VPFTVIGKSLVIHSLSLKGAELNGMICTALKYDSAVQRFAVKLDGSQRVLALKAANLELYQPVVGAAPPVPPKTKWTDEMFPPVASSLGDLGARASDLQWVRALSIGMKELYKDDQNDGLKETPVPNDIKQGNLGDCWLLSAIACLARFPTDIEKLFISEDGGKHTLRLFCTGERRFVDVSVDDHIPVHCVTRRPSFAGSDAVQYRGRRSSFSPTANVSGKYNGLWVMLLEKAFAKAFGSYSAIEGGFSWFAFQMLTGCDTSTYHLKCQVGQLSTAKKGQKKEDATSATAAGSKSEKGLHMGNSTRREWVEYVTNYADESYSVNRMDTQLSSQILFLDRDGPSERLFAAEMMFQKLKVAHGKSWLIATSSSATEEDDEVQQQYKGSSPQRRAPIRMCNAGLACPDSADGKQNVSRRGKGTGGSGGSGGSGTAGAGCDINGRASLLDGHVYSVLDVVELGGFQLLKVQNPWGTFEWDGDWSDRDRMWNEHPDLKDALQPVFDEDDGLFWMSWFDFCEIFDSLTVAKRGVPIVFNKAAEFAEKCLHCAGPIITGMHEQDGKLVEYDGKYYGYSEGKVHSECHYAYQLATSERCLHCAGPVCEIEGKYDGKYFEIDEEGRVHSECRSAFVQARAGRCIQCKGPVCEVEGRFGGQYFELEDGRKIHSECHEAYQLATADKCLHCEGPICHIEGRFEGRYYEIDGKGRVHHECSSAYSQANADRCAHCSGPVCEVEGKFEGRYFKLPDGNKVHSECNEAYQRGTAQRCLHCREPVCRTEGKFEGRYYDIDGEGRVHGECHAQYLQAKAPKCTHCQEPLCEIVGKFEGRYYEIEGKGRVHSECHGAFVQARAERCLHCEGPVCEVEGRFSGRYFSIGDDGGDAENGMPENAMHSKRPGEKGKVHGECYESHCVAKAEKCLHCRGPVHPIEGKFCGKYYTLDAGKVHSECHHAFVQATADKCLHCQEPVCQIEGRFEGRYFAIEGEGKVHSECHRAFAQRGNVGEGRRRRAHRTSVR
jgi:hypothetical protein